MITGQVAGIGGLRWEHATTSAIRRLVKRGVSQSDAEDAVQEAVLRALTKEVAFDDDHHLRRWMTVVAWRIAVDDYRRQKPEELSSAEIRALDADPAEAVEQRDAAVAVLSAIPLLRDMDRAALFDATVQSDRTAAVRANVRRHRARQRLLLLVEGFLGWWVALRRTLGRAPRSVSVGIAPLSVALFLALGVPGFEWSARNNSDGVDLELGMGASPDLASTDTPSTDLPSAHPAGTEPARPAAEHAKSADAGGRRIVEMEVPTPTGKPARAGLRESEHEPEVCARVLEATQCVDVSTKEGVTTNAVPLPPAVGALPELVPTP